MVLDLQGSGYHLFDPEIASRDIIEEGEYLLLLEICQILLLTILFTNINVTFTVKLLA